MKKVEIYTLNYCPFCKKAKDFLRNKNIEFKEIDITENEDENFQKLAEFYKIEGEVTAPQIIIGGIRIGGYTDLIKIERNGELDKLLSE